jgi:hypothetical protein
VISWLITWFSHDVKDISTVARLFDSLLCSHPLYALYMCAALPLQNRMKILECESDFATLHTTLVQMARDPFDVERLISDADKLMKNLPPNALQQQASSQLKRDIWLGSVQIFSSNDIKQPKIGLPDRALLRAAHLRPLKSSTEWGWISGTPEHPFSKGQEATWAWTDHLTQSANKIGSKLTELIPSMSRDENDSDHREGKSNGDSNAWKMIAMASLAAAVGMGINRTIERW